LLAAGADDQVGIGDVRRVKEAGKAVRRDVVRLEFAVGDELRGALGRAHDFLPGPVVEGDDQCQVGVIFGEFFGFGEQPRDVGFEPFTLADDAHAHAAFVQLRQIVADEAAQQPHQFADFACGPRPVLGAEGEDGDDLDADFAGGADRASHRLDAAPVALDPRHAACRRPAPVAIHDDGDVVRHFRGGRCLLMLGVGHSLALPQTVRISFSFAASS